MGQKIIGRFRHSDGSVGRFNFDFEAAKERAEASGRPGQAFSVLPPEPATPDGSPQPAEFESVLPR